MAGIGREMAETYKLCLHQQGMTGAACAADRTAFTKLEERLAWPPEQSAYQSFAGNRLRDAVSFLTLLCLFPVVFGYVLVRAVFEGVLWFARARPQDVALRQ